MEQKEYRGLLTQRRGPVGAWKLRPEIRYKIILTAITMNTINCSLIKDRLKENWKEEINEDSIREKL